MFAKLFFIPVKNSIILPRIENLFGKENENTTYKRVFSFLFVKANKNTKKTVLKTIINLMNLFSVSNLLIIIHHIYNL